MVELPNKKIVGDKNNKLNNKGERIITFLLKST